TGARSSTLRASRACYSRCRSMGKGAFARHYSMLMTTSLRTTACGRVGYVRGFRVQIRKQIPRIDIRDSQGRHTYRGELSRQSECRRIFGGEHLFRIADEACKPSPITPRGYVAQIGPDTITP